MARAPEDLRRLLNEKVPRHLTDAYREAELAAALAKGYDRRSRLNRIQQPELQLGLPLLKDVLTFWGAPQCSCQAHALWQADRALRCWQDTSLWTAMP